MRAALVFAGAMLLLPGVRAHAATLRVMVDGYAVVLLGTQWATPGEEQYTAQPLADRAGNVYQIAGGPPGETILRSAEDGIREFAQVSGAGNPRVVGFWFDRGNDMIVVVRRLASTREDAGSPGRSVVRLIGWGEMDFAHELAYYKIKGFPPSGDTGRLRDAGVFGLGASSRWGRPVGFAGLIVVFLGTGILVMLHQLEHDIRALWHRR